MTTQFIDVAQRAAADGHITADELLALRREGWGDGIITRAEAEALFAVNDALRDRTPEWCDFFVEAIGEFVLNGTPPRLQCSLEEAEWLIGQIDKDGRVESFVELEAMVRIIERAENVPERLKDYVLAQIEREVLTGTGPTRSGGDLSATHISAAECRIIRRVIFASGGSAPAAVSRFEAEMLFRLKDATLADENAAEWDDLFLDGVANFMKGFVLPNAQLSHERKRELEAFVADNDVNIARFMSEVIRELPNVGNHFGKVFGKKPPKPEHTYIETLAIEGEKVTDFESEWLDKLVAADGETDDLERRLIARLASETQG
ncbi:hypothetical protein [Erythrobacter colymbi]|uniref:hypothetical protein n=1 Tax=Erythrobacter colymbi TaxID=1161202 RepID=UPI000A3AC9C0|nr:hypothetical protein [Erythrobacter colymbi]